MQKNIYRVILTCISVSILIFGIIITYAGYEFYRRTAESELETLAEVCADDLARDGDAERIFNFLTEAADYDIRVTYIADDGSVIFDSGGAAENHLSRSEVQTALTSGFGTDTRVSETLGKNMYYCAVKTGGGVLRLAREYRNMLNVFLILLPIFLLVYLGIILLAAIASKKLSLRITEPIECLGGQISGLDLYSMRPVKIETDCKELIPIAKTTEQMADEISKHLEEVEKTAEIRREFTANVTHELKTPLTTIRGFADMMRNGMITDVDEAVKISKLIYGESERLLNMINDIIELSRIEENCKKEMSEVSLDEIAKHTVELMSEKAVQHGVHLHLSADSVVIPANEGYMTQLFINLVDNAIKYNRPDGDVWIRVSKTREKAVISVEDNGIGISAENQERIFERFYRADKSRSTPGTGLGLSIVKHIAAYHDAAIELQSAEGEGTRITVTMKIGGEG